MSATIKELEAAVANARDANRLAIITLIGTARATAMLAREGHLTPSTLASLMEAVEAQIETEQAVALAGAAVLAALAGKRSGEGAAP